MDEYYSVIQFLPEPLRTELKAMPPERAACVQEIRLRAGQAVQFTVGGAWQPAQQLLPAAQTALAIGPRMLRSCFAALCRDSAYAYEDELKQPVRHAAFCVVWDELPPMPVLMLPEEPEPLPPQAVSVSAAASVQPKTVQDIFFVIIETLPFLPHRKGAFGLVCPESSGFISRLPRSVVSFTLKGSAAAARCPAQCPADRYGSPIPVPPGI